MRENEINNERKGLIHISYKLYNIIQRYDIEILFIGKIEKGLID